VKVAGAPDAPLGDCEFILEAVCGDAGILWGQRNDRHPLDLRPRFRPIPTLTTETSVAYARLENQAEDHALMLLFDVAEPQPNDDAVHV
jgi:hypothetical protein